jgi:LPXTG-site transpeptidase (sortase) family protein
MVLWPCGQTAYAHWSQYQLRNDWSRSLAQQAAHPDGRASSPQRFAKAADATVPKTRIAALPVRQLSPRLSRHNRRQHRRRSRAWPPTRLVIPDVGVDALTVQGIDAAALRRGPGHDPASALPGEAGNCVLAGHRNIYGSYLYRADSLMPGAAITLQTPHAAYTYYVVKLTTVPDNDVSLYRPIDPSVPQLTIVTCTLPHGIDRLVITAQMDDVEGATAAAQ